MGSHSRSVWTSEQFPHTFRTNQDHSWLDVCNSLGGHSDLMKLLLGTCWIPLKLCRSHSDFLGAVERLFELCESWLCLSLKICHQRPKVLLCSYICVIDWACFIQQLFVSSCFALLQWSWTREFTVAYTRSLANLKLVECPLNCQGSVNSNALEGKLNVN